MTRRAFWIVFDTFFVVWNTGFFLRAIANGDAIGIAYYGFFAMLMLVLLRMQLRAGKPHRIHRVGAVDITDALGGRFDFSQFHPLDHPWWACMGYPGGLRRHLSIWHQYAAPDPLGWVMCKLGHHDWVPTWDMGRTQHMTVSGSAELIAEFLESRPAPTRYTCERCWEEKPA